MKRIVCALLALIMLIPLSACNTESEKYDGIALPFLRALIARDEAEMEKYLHPDYRDSALPDDGFYKALSEQYFTEGNTLDGLDSVAKDNADELNIDGTAKRCTYVARTNELFYTVDLIILDNENGFGIVSVAMQLNTDPKYYNQTDK